MATPTKQPDTLRVWRSNADRKWYASRVDARGRSRMTSSGYVHEADAIACAEACRSEVAAELVIDNPANGDLVQSNPKRRWRWRR